MMMMTISQVLAHLVTVRYSPPSWRPLHWLSLVAAATGVALLLLSRGHYSIGQYASLCSIPNRNHLDHSLQRVNLTKLEGNILLFCINLSVRLPWHSLVAAASALGIILLLRALLYWPFIEFLEP